MSDTDHEASLAEEADDAETELGSPTPGGSIFDQFQPAQPEYRDGADGMPVEKDPPWSYNQALPPPLAPATLSCLAQDPDPKNGRHARLEKCRYYKRQRVLAPDIPDLSQIERFCIVESLRGINGAALCLKDSAILNCEFRDPPDPAASIMLDAIDDLKIAIGKERVESEGHAGDGRTGPRRVKGYRIFKTPEDLAQKKTTLNEDEFTEVDDGK